MDNFVHLRTHTEYSLDQGITRIPDLMKKAKNDNMVALAISDNQGLFGAIKFYEEGLKKGVKPIMACDLKMYNPETSEVFNLLVIAKNNDGYKTIMHLLSRAFSEKTNGEAYVHQNWLEESNLKNLIALSGAKEGDVGKKILQGEVNSAKEKAEHWKNLFGDDYFIELQRDGKENETLYMDGAMDVALSKDIPVVATHPTMFLNQEDFLSHEAKICIKRGDILYDINRKKEYNKEQYFKTQSEMKELFADIPSAIENTVQIAKKCNLQIKLGVPNLPEFTTPNGESVDDFFENQAKEGLKKKLAYLFPNLEDRKREAPQYVERLYTEIKTIKNMGFVGYFLIVSDFIKWGKEQGIPVGPGRGSGAGSLVAYCLDITEIDPLKYELLFERFLNPERVSMPDFDIDFCQDRRTEVIGYVTDKYGQNAVSQIGTFGSMAAKSAVRDVGRTLNYPYGLVDGIAKMINIPPNTKISLAEFIEADEKMSERLATEPNVKKLMDIAVNLEGLTRQIGKHAAGVLISPTTIDDYTPLYQGSDSEGFLVSQFDKDDVEKAGLVKFDFLGLRNLTIVNNALGLINQRPEFKNKPLVTQDIQYATPDPEVIKLFHTGNTTGIFQFESMAAKGLSKKAKPNNFEDIVALTALNRPGPIGSGMVNNYIDRKHGNQEIDYLHPCLQEILEPTYGIIVYQEQVMQIAQKLAGYTLGGADLLRRAMGKKKPEEMAKQKDVFVKGAKEKNNVPEEQSEFIFNLIEKFAEYGFNKSHSAAYTVVTYQTAYLKAHFPKEFFVATMNSELDNTDQLSLFTDDAKTYNNIEVYPVDVNKSNYQFSIDGDGIRYGFGALKGVGVPAANAIEKARREKGEFTSFQDFIEKVGKGPVNKRALEALIRAGAFDKLHANRNELFSLVEPCLEYLTKTNKQKLAVESPLEEIFGTKQKKTKEPVEYEFPIINPQPEWDDLILLQNEKLAYGFYFSASPFKGYSSQLGDLHAVTPLGSLSSKFEEEGKQNVLISGVITEIKPFKSKKGATMKIMDNTGSSDLVIFAGTLDANKDWLKEEQFASFLCKLQPERDGDGHSLVVDLVYDFDKTYQIVAEKVFGGLSNEETEATTQLAQLEELFKNNDNKGDVEFVVCGFNPETGKKNKKIADFKINCNPTLMKEIKKLLGEQWVKTSFKDYVDPYTLVKSKPYKKNYM